jgi:hypothetical protein
MRRILAVVASGFSRTLSVVVSGFSRTSLAIALALALLAPWSPKPLAQSNKADVALRAAMETETVKGDLKGAIEQYKKIAESSDRVVAAKALLRMADCYQKLGDAQARGVYERLVREFGDQTDVATVARVKLGGSNAAARPTGDRMVWDASEFAASNDGRVSLDGRYVSYIDYVLTGNLMLHDLASGTDRALTGNKDWTEGEGAAYNSTFARDGRQIAYGWRTPPHVNDLRIITIDGPGTPQPRLV